MLCATIVGFAGYIDLAKREFTHPATGERMSLVDAIRRGYIQGNNDEIRNAITRHYEKMKLASIKKAVMEYSTTKVSCAACQICRAIYYVIVTS